MSDRPDPPVSSAAKRPEKLGDRVVMPDGTEAVVVGSHPTIAGAVLVQPVQPDMRWYMREELRLVDA